MAFENKENSNSSNSDDDTECGICGEQHTYESCGYVSVTNHVSDKEYLSRARLSLPESLEIKTLADTSESVYSLSNISSGTEFGPVKAKKLLTLKPEIVFPLKIFPKTDADFSAYYLDTSDENECNWMIFVNPAKYVEEQNLICYQKNEEIYFVSTKEINIGESLKVWYSPFYASKMQCDLLGSIDEPDSNWDNPENVDDLNILIQKQQNIVSRSVWNCKFCYKLEKDVTVFASHLRSHYKARLGKVCEICNEKFLYRKEYTKHLRLIHGDGKDKGLSGAGKKQDTGSVKTTTPDSKDMSIGGPLLQYTVDSLDNSNLGLQKSDFNNMFDINDTDNLLIGHENLNLGLDWDFHLTETVEKNFTCDICLKSFKTLRSITEHLTLHTGKYYCKQCKLVFGRLESLKSHKCLRTFEIKCDICNRLFYQKKFYTYHMTVWHQKKFTCKNCNKFYMCESALKTHVCTSVPEQNRPQFKCTVCFKVFFKEIYLKRHLKVHDKTSNDNTREAFPCAVCGDILSTKKIYIRHLNKHKGKSYSCNICDKNFNRRDYLRDHLMTHIAEETFCTICKKKFRSKKRLQLHIREIHSDVRHKCDTCGKEFKIKNNLVRHIKTRHKNKPDVSLDEEVFECDICHVRVKLKRSLQRHLKRKHPDEFKQLQLLSQSESKTDKKNNSTKEIDKLTNQKCMELKESLENMDFTTDVSSDKNIDSMFTGVEIIDRFLKESTADISDNFSINILQDISISTVRKTPNLHKENNREVCLSMPELGEEDQEIQMDKHGFILK